jgi:hypothetical protein
MLISVTVQSTRAIRSDLDPMLGLFLGELVPENRTGL